MLNGLDLFSGIGGIAKALEPWSRPVAYCEVDRYCQGVLLSRMASGELPRAAIWDDVRTLLGSFLPPVQIITAGFPCQDISENRVGEGLAGERSGLFWEIMRLAQEIKPAFIFLENVRNIRSKGLGQVVRALADCGYDCRWDILPAYEDEDFFEGERWFCLAKATSERLEGLELPPATWQEKPAHAHRGLSKDWKISDCGLLRDDNEVPVPVDQVRALGNAVVPLQAREAFMRLMGISSINTEEVKSGSGE